MAHREFTVPGLTDDPLWYKDAIIYELHVRSFFDSNDDGIGDFRGLTEKLDYLQDLGVTALWLLPFYPSPLKDDGYDIADYTAIHPAYGTMRDFRTFLRAAHRRGLRVITELVINHTSDQHAWFQRARRAAPGTPERDFYVWSDTPDKYSEARIIFRDFESSNWAWDPVAKAYYWHRFYSHQPDLNFDNPRVRQAVLQTMDFWFRMGVDGMRLDAIPYLYEREGTNCENLPETHEFIKTLRRHLDANFKNRIFLSEANQWPEDAVAYFGDGDECHMNFHFPVMPRLFMAIRTEDRFPIVDILRQTPPIPPNCQWAIFLRNHDELTLEMVTEEERDYLWRIYASDPQARINLGIRRRLAPLLGNDRRTIELMNILLFSLPGTPVIYYGDEIGMGDNIYLGDRNGVRTPMQWSSDRNAGFSRANPQKLFLPVIVDPEYHYEFVNVAIQQANPNSLLWWMKRVIALRKRYKAFGRGSIEFLYPENRKVLAFIRSYGDERILVVVNLSRLVQYVDLDLSAYRGMVPVELFGRTEFPPIGDHPFFLTLGPHAYYWFALEPQMARPDAIALAAPASWEALPVLAGGWSGLFRGAVRRQLEDVIANYLPAQRWFRGKSRPIRTVLIEDSIAFSAAGVEANIALVRVEYVQSEPEVYVLPLAFATGEAAHTILHDHPQAAIVRLAGDRPGEEGLVYDAMVDSEFSRALLDTVMTRRRHRGAAGDLIGSTAPAFRRALTTDELRLQPSLVKTEQTNTSVVYGDRFILKLYRHLEEGTSLDLEIGRFLTGVGFPHTPAVVGAVEYHREGAPARTLAVVHEFVPNEGDAWAYTLDRLGAYFEGAAASGLSVPEIRPTAAALLDLADRGLDSFARDAIGSYLEDARLLGRRTAELHLALASDPENPAFAPEPFTLFYQRSLYQSMRSVAVQTLQLLSRRLADLPEPNQSEAREVLSYEDVAMRRFRALLEGKIMATRIRTHGDYHLGQVLYTGKDFVITDFEGEPARPLTERRLKRSPLRDVASMLRSFDYAANAALLRDDLGAGLVRRVDLNVLNQWARFWYAGVSATFLRAYLDVEGIETLLPRERGELQVLLDVYLLEKAMYELAYELNHRPDWASIPLRGLLYLLRP